MITFDPTLHIGDILVAVTVAVGGGGVLWRASHKFTQLEGTITTNRALTMAEFERVQSILTAENMIVTELKNEIRELRTVLVNQAEMRAQIVALQQKVNELAHGEGYTLPLRRSAYEHGDG